jgi:endonuclease-3
VTGPPGGTYTLVVELAEDATIEVGALGPVAFEAGWYAYTGTALGSGGFARVERHGDVAAGRHDVRHWHVDYLLGDDATRLDAVVRSVGVDAECAVAAAVDGESVPGFGCSDCDCSSHLHYAPRRRTLLDSVRRAHETAPGSRAGRRGRSHHP